MATRKRTFTVVGAASIVFTSHYPDDKIDYFLLRQLPIANNSIPFGSDK